MYRGTLLRETLFDEKRGSGGEDVDWAKKMIERRFVVVRDPEFSVCHSHALGPKGWVKQFAEWSRVTGPHTEVLERPAIGQEPHDFPKKEKTSGVVEGFVGQMKAAQEAGQIVPEESIQAEGIAGQIAHLDAELEKLMADPNAGDDLILAGQIEELQKIRDAQTMQHTSLVNEASRKKAVSMFDAAQKWMWERLKSDSKWLFVEVPTYFWKAHKEKQGIRNDQREINRLRGLTGNNPS